MTILDYEGMHKRIFPGKTDYTKLSLQNLAHIVLVENEKWFYTVVRYPSEAIQQHQIRPKDAKNIQYMAKHIKHIQFR